METQIGYRLKFIFALLLVLSAGFSARAETGPLSWDSESDEIYVETESVPEDEAPTDEAPEEEAGDDEGDAPVTEADIGDADLDAALETIEQPQPFDELGQILVQSAGSYGATADSIMVAPGEIDTVISLDGFGDAASMMHSSGYMRAGMDTHLPTGIVANAQVALLYRRYGALRQQSGIELPSDFASLINYIERYIRSNARQGAERTNGINHHRLAIQVVRASFCFGTDPFMVVAKMKQETHFSRALVSSTGAVGFSQMTGDGINEVRDQMSGNSEISMGNARSTFRQGIRCFTGLQNFNIPTGTTAQIKARLQNSWALDLIYGQIMVKALVSYVKASRNLPNSAAGNLAAYRETFDRYNGDNATVAGSCLEGRVSMRREYACSVISFFERLSAQWTRFINGRNVAGRSFFPAPAFRVGISATVPGPVCAFFESEPGTADAIT